MGKIKLSDKGTWSVSNFNENEVVGYFDDGRINIGRIKKFHNAKFALIKTRNGKEIYLPVNKLRVVGEQFI